VKDSKTGEIVPFTLENMKRIFTKAHDGNPFLYTQDWYETEPFYATETPEDRWQLVERGIIPDSTNKNYAEQTELFVNLIRTGMFPDNDIPENYQEALTEWDEKKGEITALLKTKTEPDWKRASDILVSLKITDLCREKNIDIFYRILFASLAKQRKDLPDKWVWSKTRSSGGKFVDSGSFDSFGASVDGDGPGHSSGSMGVCFSRMK
jgi:hypothetical protein